MRKILLVMISCIVVCSFAYRWGDVKWEDAKISAMENVYRSISEMLFPQIHIYEYDKETLVYNDVEQMLLPVVSSFRSSANRTSPMQNQESVGQGGNEQNHKNNKSEQQMEGEDHMQQSTEETQNQPDETEKPQETQTEDVEVQAELQNQNVMEKKVEINRTKLQDFDYLRQNFYQVDNTTTIGKEQLNATKLLEKNMKLSAYGEGPKILIYHTHSQEGYADSAKGDVSTTVVALGAELTRLLTEKYGIPVMHHTGTYDVPDHANAYANALPNIEQILRENPSIEVVIDMHRDGVPSTTYLVTEVNGKSTAQIMFFNGLSRTTTQGDLDYLKNPNIEDNLAFSFQMQLAAAEYYPGFTRKIYLKGYRYNMHVVPKAMLVEVGAQTNTFQEAKNAMEPLADLLAIVLKGN